MKAKPPREARLASAPRVPRAPAAATTTEGCSAWSWEPSASSTATWAPADNDGEGGILALTALVTPKPAASERRSAQARAGVLVLLGLFGTALLFGDGMITPAISVLSAVEGLELVRPGLESYVLPIAVTIIVGLFAIQRFGTGVLGKVFGRSWSSGSPPWGCWGWPA